MELKLQLKMSQQLVMTPQLQQAIKLLQLSRLELVDEVRKELEGNPLLSEEETGKAPAKSEAEDHGPPSEATHSAILEEQYSRSADSDAGESEKATREVDWEKFLENRSTQQAPPSGVRTSNDDLPPIEQSLTRPSSLREHLLWQLQMGDFTVEELRFGELVFGNLNDNGYLDLKGVELPDGTRTPDLTIEDLADEAGLDPEDAPLVLEMFQKFDPIGVAARDLQECLLIQAEAFGYEDLEIEILRRHMKNLEKHAYQAIARDMKVPLETVYDAARELQKLESRPARNFVDQDDRTIAITPDVYVLKDGEEFIVVDNDRGTQRLHINEELAQKLIKDPKAKEFIGEKLRNAQWLVRAIEQRRKTILRVSECIVEKQRDFFEKGVGHLKPMILRDVAEALGMHESTISRVTTNKYMHTSRGTFELKYFFNSSIRRVANEDIASEAVKQAIKTMIDEENKKSPLSDQAIVKKLEATKGIKIARRTVAKYREMLGILSSSKRKKLF